MAVDVATLHRRDTVRHVVVKDLLDNDPLFLEVAELVREVDRSEADPDRTGYMQVTVSGSSTAASARGAITIAASSAEAATNRMRLAVMRQPPVRDRRIETVDVGGNVVAGASGDEVQHLG